MNPLEFQALTYHPGISQVFGKENHEECPDVACQKFLANWVLCCQTCYDKATDMNTAYVFANERIKHLPNSYLRMIGGR